MGKNKLERFDEIATYDHVVQPKFADIFQKDHPLKGKWASDFFKNDNPVVLELACGKGEYAVGMARKFKNKNFIGIDIKGARIWRGAKTVVEEGLDNVGFIRTRIEVIESFFAAGEVSEIWITFPDPQLKKAKKRLTSSIYLERFRNFLSKDGSVNLKTDNKVMYHFTKDLIALNQLEILRDTGNLYESEILDDVLSIRTFYESMWLEQGLEINFVSFKLNQDGKVIENPPTEEE